MPSSDSYRVKPPQPFLSQLSSFLSTSWKWSFGWLRGGYWSAFGHISPSGCVALHLKLKCDLFPTRPCFPIKKKKKKVFCSKEIRGWRTGLNTDYNKKTKQNKKMLIILLQVRIKDGSLIEQERSIPILSAEVCMLQTHFL